jgi:hypothetical protein
MTSEERRDDDAPARRPYRLKPASVGRVLVDSVDNIGAVLDALDEADTPGPPGRQGP